MVVVYIATPSAVEVNPVCAALAARTVTRPFSKLNRLCAEAKKRGGRLSTFAAVASAVGLTPGRVTQVFGFAQEEEGIVLKGDRILGAVAGAFARDGVQCEVDWFYAEYSQFAARVAAGQAQALRSN